MKINTTYTHIIQTADIIFIAKID